MIDPLELSWGNITPELANERQRIAVHVINHKLTTGRHVALNVAFLRARVRWFSRHLPPGWVQWVRFDDTGQVISSSYRNDLRQQVSGVARFTFASESSP